MGFALVVVLMAAGSLNLREIVHAQSGSVLHWFWLPLLPMFVVYVISGIAETNRAPFDVAEGESEIVAGFHVEYSGMSFSVFFLAEYANMILISVLISILFLGGWLSPFEGIFPDRFTEGFPLGPGVHWFLLKVMFFMFLYLWLRATFPRYRLRPNHATGVESVHSAHHRLDRGGRVSDPRRHSAMVRRRVAALPQQESSK